ncbi:MAG: asparaginase [Terriglobia bacterium]
MNSPKVLFIFTGGTMSMKFDPEIGAAVPAYSGKEVLAMVPHLDSICRYELIDFARIPGPHMTPEKMFDLSKLLNAQLGRDDIAGAVVTHGTDALEETAYFLELTVDSYKPVAVIGAMRHSGEIGWDGATNVIAAARVVLDPEATDRGVMVVMNDEICTAREVTKTHTEAYDAFKSPEFGPIGLVDRDRIMWVRGKFWRKIIRTDRIETSVDMFKTYAGFDPRLIHYAIDTGAKGLVIESMGRGNTPPAAFTAVKRALEIPLPVVICSRSVRGRVLDTYGYEGAGKQARRLGAIFGGNLPGQKARIKLILALGKTSSIDDIRNIFEEGVYF